MKNKTTERLMICRVDQVTAEKISIMILNEKNIKLSEHDSVSRHLVQIASKGKVDHDLFRYLVETAPNIFNHNKNMSTIDLMHKIICEDGMLWDEFVSFLKLD